MIQGPTPRRAALLLLAALISPAPAQMEKRTEDLYDPAAFRGAAPAVGTVAADFVVADLEGRPVALSSFRGRTLILVKGGYT